MNVKKMMMFTIILMAVLVAVGCQNSENDGSIIGMRMIDVDLQLPETFEPGEVLTIKAAVTLQDEPVEDADDVNFEIWRQGHGDQSESHIGKHIGDGVYAVDYTFPEAGVYYVVSHVTVAEMHNMPRKKIIVGEVSQEELEAEDRHSGSMN